MDHQFNTLIPSIDYFVERRCSPDWNIPRSMIHFYDLTYVYKGKATYILNDKRFALSAGDFIFIPKGTVREAYTDAENPMHCFAFNFDYIFLDKKKIDLPFPSVFRGSDDYELVEIFRKFSGVWLEKNKEYLLKSRAIFMLILHKLLSDTSKDAQNQMQDKRIQMIKKHILNHYHKEIKAEELAALVDLNPVYLGTWFRKKTGVTIKEYTNSLRVRAAEALLATGGYSVAEAAYRCGFEDPFYFSKVFKKNTGKSPSLYKIKNAKILPAAK